MIVFWNGCAYATLCQYAVSLVNRTSPSSRTCTSSRNVRSSGRPMTKVWPAGRWSVPPWLARSSPALKAAETSSVSLWLGRIVTTGRRPWPSGSLGLYGCFCLNSLTDRGTPGGSIVVVAAAAAAAARAAVERRVVMVASFMVAF
ncbi:hypothetical protein VM1G_11562 [Cytospora mali]|uniref:Uncharacterized protein n=1 Tax=Cytospora mali TaxID=578113 RepID=A0A194VY63_CYTMA|nr:hypothetical protein VM1G_11562 [Valsa mali]